MKKKRIVLCAAALLLVLGIIWMIWGNVTVGLTSITVTEENLPAGFDGYRIAHVSDLHNSGLWAKAIARLKEAKPDIICITGDLVDANHTDVEAALAFAAEAVQIAPCYYIPGNHEEKLAESVYAALTDGLRALGVSVLCDVYDILTCGGDTVSLGGLGFADTQKNIALGSTGGYRILLAHHPEYFADYAAEGFDLVLSGHAHGGQFRLPFIGGLVAPGQGFFPEYDSGVYTDGSTDMVVSRGIGNSIIPIRFANRPEVILIELRCG